MDMVKKMYPSLPIYGVGLSLGGATAYHLSRKYPKMFDGTVLMAPALTPPPELIGKFNTVSTVLGVLSFFLPSHLKIGTIKVSDNCRNIKYEEYCNNDQYFQQDRVKLGTLISLRELLGESKETFKDYDQPFMVIHGGCDKIVDPQVAFDLYSMTKTPEKDK